MTGDGVNDILPVRTADVGVAMQSGSPATRGVADLVLVRDDFSILPEAIRDGQRIVAAMAATLTVLLARTFYVLLIIVGCGAPPAALPVHAPPELDPRVRHRGRPDPRPRPVGSARPVTERDPWPRPSGSRSRCHWGSRLSVCPST